MLTKSHLFHPMRFRPRCEWYNSATLFLSALPYIAIFRLTLVELSWRRPPRADSVIFWRYKSR